MGKVPAPMLALCLHQIFEKQTDACTCACTFGNYAGTFACICKHYAYTILALVHICQISFRQICGDRVWIVFGQVKETGL